MWKLRIGKGEGPWLMTTNNHVGREYWEFDPNAGTPEERAQVDRFRQDFKKNRFQKPQSSDLLIRMQLTTENPRVEIPGPVKLEETDDVTEEAVTTTARRAITFYSTIQAHDGQWPCDIAGPLHNLPPFVIALYVTGVLDSILSKEHKKEMIRYIYNHQNEDGGWGLDVEGPSTMLGSAGNYVTLRLLGEGPDDGDEGAMSKGRKWILDHGGAAAIPSYGKCAFAILGVYDWDGYNGMPPELLLLPKCFPFHPGNMMCYCRTSFLPTAYLNARRFVGTITPLVESLREEIYNEAYGKINWKECRFLCAKEDRYVPRSRVQEKIRELAQDFSECILKHWPFNLLRNNALRQTMEQVHYEEINNRYIGCGDKVFSMLASWVEDPNSDAFKFHLARVPDYFWMAEDGMKMQFWGAPTWHVEFAVQAIIASDLGHEYMPMLRKAHDFLKAMQVQENPSGDFEKMHRHMNKGSWTFSVPDHSWQVVDCTAEAMKAVLLLSQFPPDLVGEKMESSRLYDAVNIILSLQSKDGGFAAWEPRRVSRFWEVFNPFEFTDDMLFAREYMECTSSAIQGLTLFQQSYPAHRTKEINRSIAEGIKYIERVQNSDGSWHGYYGICYTYGAFFAVAGLVGCGKTYQNCTAIRKSCQFLLSKQLPDGGWGESYISGFSKVYTNLEGNKSDLVQTSWALLSLIISGQLEVDPAPVNHGMRLLINSQMEDGDFPQQVFTGMFMMNCTMNYSSYRNIYPIRALGEYRRRVCNMKA